MSQITSTAVIRLLEDLYARWGVAKIILSDNGVQFTSADFEHFLARHSIEHRLTSLYNPQCNGGIERFNKVIKEGLKIQLKENKSLKEAIRNTAQQYRATPHALTNVSPAELMIGREIILPIDKLSIPNDSKDEPHIKDLSRRIANRQSATKAYTANDQSRFKQGDWVRIKRPKSGHKLKTQLSVPHRINEKVGPYTII